MLNFQAQKRKRRSFKTHILIILSIFLIVILAKPTWNMLNKYFSAREQLLEAERQLEELKERESFLNSAIEEIQSTVGQEKEIVRKFDVVREGESLAVIVEPEIQVVEEVSDVGFFKKYFGWFFGSRD